MALLTLTTDLGLRDFYVPAVKGFILTQAPHANIVDISHRVTPFNIAEASFIFRNCYNEFPEGTVHIISVESSSANNGQYLLTKAAGHFFITCDNGLISLVLDEEPEAIYKLPPAHGKSKVFPLRYIMADAASKLLNGKKPGEIGEAFKEMELRTYLRPMMELNFIRGSIIYIDNFGNAITNIRKKHFERHTDKRKVLINFSRTDYFTEISTSYDDVPEGEKVCLINTEGYMEIAINKGSAASLLGLNVGHSIIVEFS